MLDSLSECLTPCQSADSLSECCRYPLRHVSSGTPHTRQRRVSRMCGGCCATPTETPAPKPGTLEQHGCRCRCRRCDRSLQAPQCNVSKLPTAMLTPSSYRLLASYRMDAATTESSGLLPGDRYAVRSGRLHAAVHTLVPVPVSAKTLNVTQSHITAEPSHRTRALEHRTCTTPMLVGGRHPNNQRGLLCPSFRCPPMYIPCHVICCYNTTPAP